LLDQDSQPAPGSIEALLAVFLSLDTPAKRSARLAPCFVVAIGLTHGFHQCMHWRWKRVYPSESEHAPVPYTSLNGSGTLMRIDSFLEMGGLNEVFFIDHVDTEWSFRFLAYGLELWGILHAVFLHRMGQKNIRYWFLGWRIWPSRPPARHYFLFRNAL
jgi:rhamnosyltransferase